MLDYAVAQEVWTTPNGRLIAFRYRKGTNDWNTVNACVGTNDEYGLAGRKITGQVLDVGGYLGSVGITIAVDNPEARVLIVEPVPWNAALIRENAELNKVADRVTVFEGAVGEAGQKTSEIRFGYVGDANLEHHAFVGNSSLAYDTGGDTPHDKKTVPTLGLSELLDQYEIDRVAFMKIDCEGGEWPFLDTPDVDRIDYLVGEAHSVRGHTGADIEPLLDRTHVVTLSGNPEGTCGFAAVRRG